MGFFFCLLLSVCIVLHDVKLPFLVQVGAATAIGEQPIKGLVDPCCGARMSVAESLTNLMFARISSLKVYMTILMFL